ncbi:unnamed protein product [Rotaria magnacalcarata]|uniref:Uncharacterized protein n=1 Tax=Rotaria magnacalcarata TaxID=392030 RepID=A0A814YLW0_9BILA|nr:unnamed protein product [Rotaria magnacalcarata]CAF1499483.1 unnamed protein product [Rotaria magnacalcarata]CAF4814526.1 unnamed protein product [Rotaria magnacalcarata]CAF4993767.1 unnamed protein product [Rotaria magnacalcarata]
MVKIIFILLIIILNICHVDNLICMSHGLFKISRNQIISTKEFFTLGKLTNKTTDSTIKNNSCYVKILIDHDQVDGNVTIEFSQNKNYTVNKFTYQTSFLLSEYYDSIISTIEYTCSSDDLCDKTFVNRWIHWISDINYEPLKKKFINVTTSSIQSNRCYIVSGKIIEYSYWMRFYHNKTILSYSDCSTNQSIIPKLFYIKMESIDLKKLEYDTLAYNCMSEKCFDEITFNYIWNETSFLFDRMAFVVESIGFTNQMNDVLDASSKRVQISVKGEANNYIITLIRNYSADPFVFFSFFIIILLIICCCWCYCCLCLTTSKQLLEAPANA